MWGEANDECELGCQCSGLITDSFRINSGNNATKRRHEEAIAHNYKYKMNPHPLNFENPLSPLSNKLSPVGTPKRRVLGEIQNSPLAKILKQSPHLDRSIPFVQSPLTSRTKRNTTKISRIFEDRFKFRMNKENASFYEKENKLDVEEETQDSVFCDEGSSFGSPVGRGSKCSISGWTLAKLTTSPTMETPRKLLEDTSRDSGYSNSAQKMSSYLEEQTVDFSQIIASTSYANNETVASLETPYVPDAEDLEMEADAETLHDLEEEFESENFDECSKYEIISTDSPNIISRGRSARKITSKNFVFGAPIAEVERSTSFNKPGVNATRMLNFDEEETFEFTSPMQRAKGPSVSVKKSLKFQSHSDDSPGKTIVRDKSDSSIGSMSSTASQSRLCPSGSATSMESGFISEMDETTLDIEEASSSPKVPNLSNLICGRIKINDEAKRPLLFRSISCSESKRRSCDTIFEGPAEKRHFQNVEDEVDLEVKRRKSAQTKPRPVLQRAYSETAAATIMSALARSASDPDLIGDFSLPFALPLTAGAHADLKAISSGTLAALLRGHYRHAVGDFQVIDCRYPYEFAGGHIRGARNLYTPAHVLQLVGGAPASASASASPASASASASPRAAARSILVFHCEFSVERGPKLSRFLRSSDRAMNKDNYPSLHYPEVYLLHEGYKNFYTNYPELCVPEGYTPMLDPVHKKDLQLFRSQSEGSLKKSLSTDDRKVNKHRSRSRLLL